jgi:diguanylate cyclase (GGDEF)-like protein/PAS domain S-box-containing protein
VGEAIVVADLQRRILMVNEGFSRLTGYRRSDVLGRGLGTLFGEGAGADLQEAIWSSVERTGSWQGEVRSRRRDGEAYRVQVTVDAVGDSEGRSRSYVCSASDITAVREAQNRLHYLAHHDCLTGLANRLLFSARLQQSIDAAGRYDKRIGLLFVDIDDFKIINDTLGHGAGDRFLQAVAERLQAQVRRGDTVARLGGDEFAVIVEEGCDPAEMAALAARLRGAIGMPLKLAGRQVCSSASIGIGVYPDDGRTPEALLNAADAAMYEAKSVRRGGPLPTLLQGVVSSKASV